MLMMPVSLMNSARRGSWCPSNSDHDPFMLPTFTTSLIRTGSITICKVCSGAPHKVAQMIKYLVRDPLDQYSDWPCNKCDFSLEVTFLPFFCFFSLLGKYLCSLNPLSWLHSSSSSWTQGAWFGEKDWPNGGGAQWSLCKVRESTKSWNPKLHFWLICFRKDLKRLEFFIKELQGAVLHPNHYLLLIARWDNSPMIYKC